MRRGSRDASVVWTPFGLLWFLLLGFEGSAFGAAFRLIGNFLAIDTPRSRRSDNKLLCGLGRAGEDPPDLNGRLLGHPAHRPIATNSHRPGPDRTQKPHAR